MNLIARIKREIFHFFSLRRVGAQPQEGDEAAWKYFKKNLPTYQTGAFPKKGNVALLVTSTYLVEIELVYAKALVAANYRPVLLVMKPDWMALRKIKACGLDYINYSAFRGLIDWEECEGQAERLLSDLGREKWVGIIKDGVHLGSNALASFLRHQRKHECDFSVEAERRVYSNHFKNAYTSSQLAKEIYERIKPSVLVVNDRVYSPVSELFQLAVSRGIRVLTRNSSQNTGYEVIKSYQNPESVHTHPHSLSSKSWDTVKGAAWKSERWEELKAMLYKSYESGDWFAEVGTQFNKMILSKEEVLSRLGWSSENPIAVVFSHIFWDGTMSYGSDLFDNYYDWFVHVVEAASKNTNVNWIFKIHPANMVKAKRDGVGYESEELKCILSKLGSLPEHIRILESDSDVSTYCLFGVMDYCLTVRGTVGIESAAFGVRTLTAGTGRYDRMGFTKDFESRESYLDALSYLHTMPQMSETEIELARKYAYAVFLQRHLFLDPIKWVVSKDETASQTLSLVDYRNWEKFSTTDFCQRLRELLEGGDDDILVQS